jgi:V/A-type H+-transporting ATPase subunit C
MSAGNLKYSAVAGKIHALYGKRLRSADYDRLSAMSSVAEIADYLREHPGWATALQDLPPGQISRVTLETALKTQMMDEFSRIFIYLPKNDKTLPLFVIQMFELECITNALRRVLTGSSPLPPAAPSERLARSSPVDFARLGSCRQMDDLLGAIQGSIYHQPLAKFIQTHDRQDYTYTALDVLLGSTYYGAQFATIRKNHSGKAQAVFLQAIGEQVDLLNIAHILRSKRFLPANDEEIVALLYPYHYKLDVQTVHRLYTAESTEAAWHMLKETPYAALFAQEQLSNIEDYAQLALYNFCRKWLSSGVVSAYLPLAYWGIKRLELHNLFMIIECAKYQLSPGDADITLIGI